MNSEKSGNSNNKDKSKYLLGDPKNNRDGSKNEIELSGLNKDDKAMLDEVAKVIRNNKDHYISNVSSDIKLSKSINKKQTKDDKIR